MILCCLCSFSRRCCRSACCPLLTLASIETGDAAAARPSALRSFSAVPVWKRQIAQTLLMFNVFLFLHLDTNFLSSMSETYITPAYEILITAFLKHIQSAFASGVIHNLHVIIEPRLELPSESFSYFKMWKCWKYSVRVIRVLIFWHVTCFPDSISLRF